MNGLNSHYFNHFFISVWTEQKCIHCGSTLIVYLKTRSETAQLHFTCIVCTIKLAQS